VDEEVIVPDRLAVCEGVTVDVRVRVGVMGGETLALCVDVIVKDPVVVKELVFVTERDCVGVLVPELLPVAKEVDELVAEGLGLTEGVMDGVWKEVTVGLVVREGEPVPVFDFVRLAEAV
jgi:hypothetical protein